MTVLHLSPEPGSGGALSVKLQTLQQSGVHLVSPWGN